MGLDFHGSLCQLLEFGSQSALVAEVAGNSAETLLPGLEGDGVRLVRECVVVVGQSFALDVLSAGSELQVVLHCQCPQLVRLRSKLGMVADGWLITRLI